MSENSKPMHERFVILSIGQALIRKGYQVQTDYRLPSGLRVDIFAQKSRNRSQISIEVKVTSTESRVKQIAKFARQQIERLVGGDVKGFIAIGIMGTEIIFADEGLAEIIEGASDDLCINVLPKRIA